MNENTAQTQATTLDDLVSVYTLDDLVSATARLSDILGYFGGEGLVALAADGGGDREPADECDDRGPCVHPAKLAKILSRLEDVADTTGNVLREAHDHLVSDDAAGTHGLDHDVLEDLYSASADLAGASERLNSVVAVIDPDCERIDH